MALELAQPAAALAEQDVAIAAAFRREGRRLRNFIRRRVSDAFEAEDIAQDVFSALIVATRVATPIEHVGAWLFRVATNRITDGLRRKRAVSLDATTDDDAPASEDELQARLIASDCGPEARYADRLLAESMQAALAELPAAQREVFIAHELEGRSFKSLAAESGVGINTLLARKRYAVLHLRSRLRDFHDQRNDEGV
jgi:RNA polymerase sigma factor (sigma-70 family)